MSFLSIKNWSEFQHYKDRDPPWIKLHRKLLDDYDFSRLQDASKAHLMLLWLLASQMENKIPADEKWLKNKLGLTTNIDVKTLIDKGFLIVAQDASKPIAERSPEREAETEVDINKKGRGKIQKISFEDLEVDHISEWLAKKRVQGQYLDVNEERQIEKFKDYCRAKSPKYTDYTAALRNSFEWKEVSKNENTSRNKSKSERADDAVAEALAEMRGRRQAGNNDSGGGEAELRHLPDLRTYTGTA